MMSGEPGVDGVDGVRNTVPLPDLGEGLLSAEILAWRVAVGEAVRLDQVVAEIETEKTVVELPCPYEGVVTELHGRPGELIMVGAPLLTLLSPRAVEGTVKPGQRPDRVEETAHAGPSVLVGSGPGTANWQLESRTTRANGPMHEAADAPRHTLPDRRPVASPAVRRLAREMGVDLHMIQGSGPGGLITREDVTNAHTHAVQGASDD
jgi:pyruvate dehydrogenase E2 component (dihydrolipoamide acetyltransferase)